MPSSDLLTRGEKQRITRFRGHLLDWYEQYGRDFPWRRPEASVFEKICVEVLLQRTRAETVAGIYDDFFSNFIDWPDIAKLPITEIETHLKPIGLWRRRARSIKGLATYAAERAGIFPATEAELMRIPGVGQYVAHAILLFQHDQPHPLLDVNMARVLERYLRPRRLADIRYDPWLQTAAYWLVRCDQPQQVNWSILDIGSMICSAHMPRCRVCAFRVWCNTGGNQPRALPPKN